MSSNTNGKKKLKTVTRSYHNEELKKLQDKLKQIHQAKLEKKEKEIEGLKLQNGKNSFSI